MLVIALKTSTYLELCIFLSFKQILHAAGCCPPLYAVYGNGIAYGFVNGETLDENTVRDKTIRQ